jgi:CRP-like cAMP-binding protein
MTDNLRSKTNGATHFDKVFAHAAERILKAGETVFREGDKDSHFYWVREGSVEISRKMADGQPRVIAELRAGDFFGEATLAGRTQKPTTATATKGTVLLALPSEEFVRLTKEDPETAMVFLLQTLEKTNERLRRTNTKLMALFEIGGQMARSRGDLSQLLSGIVATLLFATESQDGVVCLRNPFSNAIRVAYATDPQWTDKDFEGLRVEQPQQMEKINGHWILANLKDLGFVALRRELGAEEYHDDNLRLLALVAEMAATTVQEASERASEKAKQMLQRRYVY